MTFFPHIFIEHLFNVPNEVLDILKLNKSESLLFSFKFELFSIQSLRLMLDQYWSRIQYQGFGVREIDEIIVFLTICRVTILSIRYNIKTSLVITLISTIAGYIWYTTFLSLIFRYEQ